MMNKRYDIAVIGAGFAGSLTALGLDRQGYNVILIEKKAHPRFAIGESSTPIADMILRDIADRYDLTWLHSFSRYGSWQETHPEVACGLKRGFSYYYHQAGQPFQTDGDHSHEMLLAASKNNQQSDTNWYRPDLDAFLAGKVKEAGISYTDRTTITSLLRTSGKWEMEAWKEGQRQTFTSDWFIDATGSGTLLRQLGIDSSDSSFRTHSTAVFSHFVNVKPWEAWLKEHNISTADYPYNPDSSALHHLLDEGWLWMLRFNNGITSAGLVFDETERPVSPGDNMAAWQQTIGRYPSLAELFEEASFARLPGKLLSTQRLQRRVQNAAGEGWAALPHTAGFTDPLHSTGIAHSLSGVERLLHIFETGYSDSKIRLELLKKYEKALFQEIDFIDLLVDGCYRARRNFNLFSSCSMLYFIAAIYYEQIRLEGSFDWEKHMFLSASHPRIPAFTKQLHREVQDITSPPGIDVPAEAVEKFRLRVKKAIDPYNSAGLLEPDTPNMYEHTAADLGSAKK